MVKFGRVDTEYDSAKFFVWGVKIGIRKVFIKSDEDGWMDLGKSYDLAVLGALGTKESLVTFFWKKFG